MTSYSETDRMILLNKLDASSAEHSSISPLTTVFYPDEQISSYQHSYSSTTPLPSRPNDTGSAMLMDQTSPALSWHPSNHKRQYTNVYHSNNDLEAGRASSKFSTMPQKRMFFPDDEENDYADTQHKVTSIQDILNQNDDESVSDERFVLPSMPFSRTMRVEGVYRREKKKRDHFSTMETMHRHISLPDDNYEFQPNDPFLKFKPSSPSDVNLLASNMVKFKQNQKYSVHKPHPLTTAMTLNNVYDDHYGSHDPNIIYHQIIAANSKNRDLIRTAKYEEPGKSNKPFSLMLDVYPMPDDESPSVSTTRMIPYTQLRRPLHPMGSHAISHNAQYNKDTSFYTHLKFPQLQQYPSKRSPFALPPKPKESYFHNYITNRMNGYRPVLKPPHTINMPSDERPSQITVHLNLYPDRKKIPTRSVQIIESNDTVPDSSTDESSLWKRKEHAENVTKLSSIEINPSQSAYIPPFSAIKINALQQPFGLATEPNLLLQSDQEKSIEFDMVPFDSKKLVPNIKLASTNPTSNAVASTSPYFHDISSTVSAELPSTPFSPFESTMSSSTLATNHFPFYSTNIPFETTAAIDLQTNSDQSTAIYGNLIRFPDH